MDQPSPGGYYDRRQSAKNQPPDSYRVKTRTRAAKLRQYVPALNRILNPALLLSVTDFLVASGCIYAASLLRFGLDIGAAEQNMGEVMPRAIGYAFWIMVGMISVGMYRARQRPRRWEMVARTLVAVAMGTIAFVFFFYAFPSFNTGRGVVTLAGILCALLLTFSRIWLLKLVDVNPVRRRILVLGAGKAASRIGVLRRRSDKRQFEIIGFVPTSEEERRIAEEASIGPLISNWEDSVDALGVDEIVVALDERRGVFPSMPLLNHKFHGVKITDIISFLEEELERIDLSVLNPGWLIFEASCHTNPVYEVAKRSFDIFSSVLLLIVVSPVLIGVTVAIWLEDGIGSPVLYRQQRVGKGHRPFNLFKFRSMITDAERDGAPQWSSKSDARVTATGKIIRRFRFDELPQIFNVLFGDMSMVGPRPERPEFVDEISAAVSFYDYRHCVRPGMTGWAQLNFPYGSSVADAREKLKYDLYYIKNADIIFDLFVLLQTFEVVVWGKATSMAGPDLDASNSDASGDTIRLFERRKRDAG